MATRKNALIAAALAAPLAMGATTASAVLVTEWEYNVDSGFADWNPVGGGESNAVTPSGNNAQLGLPTTLSWGDPSNPQNEQSSISITSDVDAPPADNLVTNVNSVPGATFTHNNFTITDPGDLSLTDFVIANRVELFPAAPPEVDGDPSEVLDPNPILLPSLFWETLNAGDCVIGDQPCGDIFVLQSPEALSTNFTRDGFLYTVNLEIDGLQEFDDDVCNASQLGAGPGCVGLFTEEGQVNTFGTTFSITAVEVPEPGVLGLLGLGLFGIGAASRGRFARK
ncbi:MAG: PEP-CTERM sorting domain-containing protein [Spiribacter salinus]|uniref:PEP-CTERM sorting domain-containing protein n=1 Tax=Spiribacter salinus TaxID=1335746 RepID=A0A540V8G3_9GAMM|nr:MAG: PEP-CTERM sorting domain-containing protein [Spiribacter salinus]